MVSFKELLARATVLVGVRARSRAFILHFPIVAIAPGASVRVTQTSTTTFLPSRIILPREAAKYLMATSLVIDRVDQFLGCHPGAVPCCLFEKTEFEWDPCGRDGEVAVTFSTSSLAPPLVFAFAMTGGAPECAPSTKPRRRMVW